MNEAPAATMTTALRAMSPCHAVPCDAFFDWACRTTTAEWGSTAVSLGSPAGRLPLRADRARSLSFKKTFHGEPGIAQKIAASALIIVHADQPDFFEPVDRLANRSFRRKAGASQDILIGWVAD